MQNQNTSNWYQEAIIYELHVRAFYDSDDDGNGDFAGLVQKLDYLQDLGVTAIWLLPFYPSPLKDDGYDIADYTSVHKSYGNLKDFKIFLREAHHRNIRVITELVINHTSDQHPWFQRARRAKPGSKYRDFYVWSDTSDRYQEARIIFKDFETSNWTWDPLAKAYYWHRFYSHQPDLNFDNPEVQAAIFELADYWLGMGVDGLRLDAIPYLFEREGSNCENLPETHEFLKKLRHHVDTKFPNRMLLAEANQWPEDAITYFGDGDECHMAFHFPLMPRMFMSLKMEDRFPLIDIMQQTPPIPKNCQWSIFLRNHDELTLEMVTDEERDYMYRVYAHDPQARINLGIRRRLAPLLSNNRKKIELMNGLLFSFPGTPVIYYGDEIGMGDNFYLGDRNAVRTPMQWSPDRNAGFSNSHPHRLFLPINIDPEYHYESINVAAQQNNPESLLWWMKRLIDLRKRYKAFSLGTLNFLTPDNPKVLAFTTEYEEQTILIVANLSRFSEFVELDLAKWKGSTLLELFGQNSFPAIRDSLYFLTLSPHAFYWFLIETPKSQEGVAIKEIAIPELQTNHPWETLLSRNEKHQLEQLLPKYISAQRWFGHKNYAIKSCSISECIPISTNEEKSFLTVVEVTNVKDEQSYYLLPLTFIDFEKATELQQNFPQACIAFLTKQNGYLIDASFAATFNHAIFNMISRNQKLKTLQGILTAEKTSQFKRLASELTQDVLPLRTEQSNTSVNYGKKFILKYYRHLETGENPDIEISRFLNNARNFDAAAKLAGYINYQSQRNENLSMAVLQELIPHEVDAWQYTLNQINIFFEQILTHQDISLLEDINLPRAEHFYKDAPEIQINVQTIFGNFELLTQLLGSRTAELHNALASADSDSSFTPEPITTYYQRTIYQSLRGAFNRMKSELKKSLPKLSARNQQLAQKVLEYESKFNDFLIQLLQQRMSGMRIRCHGDLHLGQVLFTGKDFVIIDFEGEPARHLSERRIKRPALRDVAGMMRSYHYAIQTVLYGENSVFRKEDLEKLIPFGQFWYHWVCVFFLKGYLETAQQQNFLPKTRQDFQLLLKTMLIEKAIYEIRYELNNRPDWVAIPCCGLIELLEQ